MSSSGPTFYFIKLAYFGAQKHFWNERIAKEDISCCSVLTFRLSMHYFTAMVSTSLRRLENCAEPSYPIFLKIFLSLGCLTLALFTCHPRYSAPFSVTSVAPNATPPRRELRSASAGAGGRGRPHRMGLWFGLHSSTTTNQFKECALV